MVRLMISFAVLALLLSTTADADSSAAESLRTPHQLRTEIRVNMRREALAASSEERTAAIRELCDLYHVIRADTRMGRYDRMQWDAKLRKRLQSVKLDLEKEKSRRNRKSRVSRRGMSGSRDVRKADGALGGAAVPPDDGQILVELIQRTIAPDIWDVNGGNASIGYFPQLHALVVRAPGGVHRRIGGALGKLRAAGQ